MRQILRPDGTLVGTPPLSLDRVRDLLAAMATARIYDRKSTSLQKQGRLATYAPFEGQEAAQVGSVAALRSDDWVVGTYRDAAAMWLHGYPWVNLFLGRMGDERGGSPPAGVTVMPPSITVGAHMLHAVGLGWGARLLGEDRVALTLFGDGATSEGDFHEAMNFAAVFATPTIFLCQNNQYAISMHRSRQTGSETIAAKAVGYGMPGELVDGNDVLAVYAATSEAVARGRAGAGPTLIEAFTYRIGPHTTTDDPGRYRDAGEAEAWRDRDPIDRVRRYLEAAGAWDPSDQAAVEEAASVAIEAAVEEAEAVTAPGPADVFDSMFAELPPHLADQRRLLERDLGDS